MSDRLERAREAIGRVEQILAGLPGIREYKDKEIRREVDRRVREELMAALEAVRSSLTDLQNEVLSAGGIRWMNDLERIHSRLTLLHDKVRSAAYGYSPLFDLERVREAELERLLAFDRDILARIPELEERLAAARAAATQSAEAFGTALRELYATLTDLLETYSRRERFAHGEDQTE